MARSAQVCHRIEGLFHGSSLPIFRPPLWIYSAVFLCLLAASGFYPMRQAAAQQKLIRQLQSPDPVERAHAAHRLRKREPAPAAIPALIALLGDRTPVDLPEEETDPGLEAARTLGAYDEEAVDALVGALASNSLEVRRDALKGLAFTHAPRAYPYLVAALSDSSWRIREQAARGLGLFGSDAGVGDLAGALSDERASVREAAAWALGMTRGREGVPGLIESLYDEDRIVRERAAWALGMIGDSRAEGALYRIEQDRREDEEVRDQARWALDMIATTTVPIMETRTFFGEYAVAYGQPLGVQLKYGSFHIEAAHTDRMQVEVQVDCYQGRTRCEKLLSQVELVFRESSQNQRLDIDYLSSEAAKDQLSVEATLTVPRTAPLSVNLEAGEVEIRGLEDDLDVELGIGDIDIELSQRAVSRVALKSNLGRPQLRGHGIEDEVQHRSRGEFGHEVEWSGGSGNAEIVVKIGTGSISVRLN